MRGRLALFTLTPTAILGLIQVVWGDGNTSWWLGFGFGALVTIYLALIDDPPAHIERWRKGAEGERRTAKALRRLRREGWRVIHDLADGKANRDHVVVGPGGVFLLDTKWPTGKVTVAGDTVRVERDDPTAAYELPRLASWMRGAAVRLKEDTERATGQRGIWVHAVVVFWGEFEQQVTEGDRVTYVHGDELVGWLRSRAPVQQRPKTEALAAALAVAARASA